MNGCPSYSQSQACTSSAAPVPNWLTNVACAAVSIPAPLTLSGIYHPSAFGDHEHQRCRPCGLTVLCGECTTRSTALCTSLAHRERHDVCRYAVASTFWYIGVRHSACLL